MQDPRTDALAFLKRNRTGFLATVDRDYKPHVSALHYTTDDKFNIYFMTLRDTKKFDALSAHSEVAFTIATQDVPQVLEIEGNAMDISTSEEAGSKKDELFEILNKNQFFYAPITKLDAGETALIWIQPTWIRWADYAFREDGSQNVLVEIPVE